ncbi:MAG TPA: UbiA family prenyltransferase [Nostocaceae cyanobacterium]|nr:UbiA family prenyltransferase [Nostocaceae cyanobacterium]
MSMQISDSIWKPQLYYLMIQREISIIWQLIKRDISSTIIPGILFTIAAWANYSSSWVELTLCLLRAGIYFFLYILTFNLSNQIVGIEEDKINKPDRPIASGLLSYKGAIIRYFSSMILFSLVGMLFGVVEWALLWQVSTLLHNEGGWSKHWLGKNLIMGVGIVAELAAAWQLVIPITSDSWRWIIVLAVVVALIVHLQDLRDVEGDRLTNRQTFPIAFGEKTARITLFIGFLLAPVAINLALIMPTEMTWYILLCDIALVLFSWLIATRVILYRSPQADHQTYMLLTYWYCLLCASATIII